MTIGRFAPSPSGDMHIGNIYCALIAWLSAKSAGGKVLLRIEDLDYRRCTGDNIKRLLDDLEFLGLHFDGGYEKESYQSRRSGIYREMLEKIAEKQTVYPCCCSRADLHAESAPHASDGSTVYSGKCYRAFLSGEAPPENGKAPALRLHLPDEEISFCDGLSGEKRVNLARECGDIILRRADGIFAYNLAVVTDDALSGVNEVVRGRDLIGVTPAQLYLYRLSGYDAPKYYHIPLILDEKGRRLSKRDGDTGLASYRRKHNTPDRLLGYIAYLAGLIPEPCEMSAEALIPLFSYEKIPKHDILLKNTEIL